MDQQMTTTDRREFESRSSLDARVVPAIMLRDVQLLTVVSLTFSVVGGALQELHRIVGASDLDIVTRQIASNLVVSVCTVITVLLVKAMAGRRREGRLNLVAAWRSQEPMSIWAAIVGGAIGGLFGAWMLVAPNFWWLVVSSAAWMLMAAVLVRIIGYAGRRIQRQADALSEAIVDLSLSRTQVLLAQTQARRTVAEELHGPVQSQLLGLEMRLRQGGDADSADALKDFRVRVVRELSHQLHPMAIDIGLLPALDELAGQTTLTTTVSANARAQELDDLGGSKLPRDMRLVVYRVVQEALLNAQTGGGAQHAWVTVNVDDEHLVLSVADDGQGLDPGAHPGLGLRSVDAWVGSCSGSWDISSRPQGGCQLQVLLPLSR